MQEGGFSATVTLRDAADTAAFGARIARELRIGDSVALAGDLGAGKTTLARAILAALGFPGPVPSPTFTLVQHYDTPRLAIGHFDLYRIEHENELDELGLDEALDCGAVLVEWPERAGGRLPPDALHVQLAITGESSRSAGIRGPKRWSVLAAP